MYLTKTKLLIITLVYVCIAVIINIILKPGLSDTSLKLLGLTQPVTSLTGTIDNIFFNTITVAKSVPSQTGKQKVIYQIKMNGDTRITTQSFKVPYLFPTNHLPIPQYTKASDLSKGQTVTVWVTSDLRLTNGEFIADSIEVLSPVQLVSGILADITKDSITVAFPANPWDPKQPKQQNIKLLSTTEISRYENNVPGQLSNPLKLTVSDLKKDEKVTVFALTEKNNELSALLVQPIITVVNIVPTFTPLPTPTSPPSPPGNTSPIIAPIIR